MKPLIETMHLSIDLDTDFIGIDITFSLHFRMINIQLLCIVIKIY